jgi:acetyltransferase-like isoleucine patch superfamily enzyme
MIKKVFNYLHAKYRAFTWLSCFDSARPDVFSGFPRWKWLAHQRKAGHQIEPSLRIQGDIANLKESLTFGDGVIIDRGVTIWIGGEGKEKGKINLGSRVYIGPYAYLGTSTHHLKIGDDSMIGAYTYIITENHGITRQDIPYSYQGYVGADVVIGKNVWIGCHVAILPGVTIGDHAIIGAGAVVTKSVPNGQIWGGVPAGVLPSSWHGPISTQ